MLVRVPAPLPSMPTELWLRSQASGLRGIRQCTCGTARTLETCYSLERAAATLAMPLHQAATVP